MLQFSARDTDRPRAKWIVSSAKSRPLGLSFSLREDLQGFSGTALDAQPAGDWARASLRRAATASARISIAASFPRVDHRDGTVETQEASARMVLDRDNQVAFSRFKGSLPFRTDVGGLDHCGSSDWR